MATSDDLARKWDRAISTTLQYSGEDGPAPRTPPLPPPHASSADPTRPAIGLAVGGGASLVLFRRSVAPVAFGLGVALGKAHSEAEHDFTAVFNPRVHSFRPK